MRAAVRSTGSELTLPDPGVPPDSTLSPASESVGKMTLRVLCELGVSAVCVISTAEAQRGFQWPVRFLTASILAGGRYGVGQVAIAPCSD